ncbi:hypothetical protein N7462_009266 [Penicillium macrosclerotiorum]|uniref:uncharacterized protein n=1 Tax=Penicillium macrosclerotiorum TaxID=303699 RepID=UPI0025481A0D|nr:uncharacterized protein N7462_009266 [Penicillium macrosclerotiorum]KAJ5673827.1 hypothetical protein N7462_009266 [Penicillium macrosclerotiorum]
MSPVNDPVFLRRNNQIQDAIDGQNLKQALQLIEKRMKKGEDTRFMKAWKAHVLFRHADDVHHQRGITETLQLCNAEPPTTDIETLDILHKTLQKLDGHGDTRTMLWEVAARAKPQDLTIQGRWFTYAFEENDWKSAQKAAMSLQKNFPKDRKYYFWAIFLSHMIAIDDTSSEIDRKLFGTLAYRMVSKAAADVPIEKVGRLPNPPIYTNRSQLLSAPRAIQTSEELLLLIKIYEAQGRFDEVVKTLDSENLGLSSRIVQNDTAFLGFKASNLGAGKMWEEAISFVKSLYTVPDNEEKRKALREIDDWNIWNLLVEATRHVKTSGIFTETAQFVEKFIEFNPKSRNAALARLEVILHGIDAGEMKADDLHSASEKYIDHHIHKLYAFDDLRRISRGNRDNMLKNNTYTQKAHGNDENSIVPTINALKMDYWLNISGSESTPSCQQIDSFVSRCMKLYQSFSSKDKKDTTKKAVEGSSSTIESQPRDELCILAAMGLLQIEGTQSEVSDTALIRAASILERLCQDSPHNYQALLLLIRIYLRLGAGSLALSTFSKLSVKQVQYDSVAHLFFTRLATIHPHSAPPIEGAEYKDFDPQSAFVQALHFFRMADANTMKYRTAGLDNGSYANTEEIIELRRRLLNSVNRRTFALDVRRMQRLVGGDPLSRYDDIAQETSPFLDHREFTAFMNCEFTGKPDFEQRVRVGPTPKANWLASSRVTDRLFSILKGISLQRPLPADIELPSLENLQLSGSESDQTETERETAQVHLDLLKVAFFMAGSNTVNPQEADKALSQVETWLIGKKNELTSNESSFAPLVNSTAVHLKAGIPTAPTWRYFHSVFTLLETIKALSQLVILASRKGSKAAKLPKGRFDQLSALVPEVFESVRRNTRVFKQCISEAGVLSSLVDLVLQGDQGNLYSKELQETLDTSMDSAAVEMFCGSLMESWEEALDGVMSVRI